MNQEDEHLASKPQHRTAGINGGALSEKFGAYVERVDYDDSLAEHLH